MNLTPESDILIASGNKNQYGANRDIIFHPINAKIGRYGRYAAEKILNSRESRKVVWGLSRNHEKQSFGRAVPVFSNKSVTFLGANGPDSYS